MGRMRLRRRALESVQLPTRKEGEGEVGEAEGAEINDSWCSGTPL